MVINFLCVLFISIVFIDIFDINNKNRDKSIAIFLSLLYASLISLYLEYAKLFVIWKYVLLFLIHLFCISGKNYFLEITFSNDTSIKINISNIILIIVLLIIMI